MPAICPTKAVCGEMPRKVGGGQGKCGARPAGQCGCAKFMCAAGSVLSGRTRRRQSGRNSHALPRPRDSHPYKTILSSALTCNPPSSSPPSISSYLPPWPKLLSSAVVSQVSRPHTLFWSAAPMCSCSTSNREYHHLIGVFSGAGERRGGSWAFSFG